jgi:hypothetical protein
MDNSTKWEEFLATATAQEVFSKIGKTITFNDKIPAPKRQEMTEKIWGRYEELRKNKQKSVFEEATDSDWWNSECSRL